MTVDEVKLGYRLLEYLRWASKNRHIHKFNTIGRSSKGEFEMWLGRELSGSEKQSLIWLWDEMKRLRLITATGTDLLNPDDWVVVTERGQAISESDFADLFSDDKSKSERRSQNSADAFLRNVIDGRSAQENAVSALTDPVTSIPTRAVLDGDLRRLTEQKPDTPHSFIMIDLDNFRLINERFGHPGGDQVLKTVAQTVTAAVAGKGKAYRYGGEELSVILPNHTLPEATAVGERIRNDIENIRIESLVDCFVTASLGVATLPGTSDTIESLVADADRALYDAKDAGRNRVCCAILRGIGNADVRRKPLPITDEELRLWLSLDSGTRLHYSLRVENQADCEVNIMAVAIEHDGIALTQPEYPKSGERWVVPPKGLTTINWCPSPNPGDALVRLNPNAGLKFLSGIDVLLTISAGPRQQKYRQKLAVRVFAGTGDIAQLAG